MLQRITHYDLRTRHYALIGPEMTLDELLQVIGTLEDRFFPQRFGAFLSTLRKETGMTLEMLSEQTDVSPALLNHYEKNKTLPPYSFLPVFVKAINMTYGDELITTDDLIDQWVKVKAPWDGTTGSLMRQERWRRGIQSKKMAELLGFRPSEYSKFERNLEQPRYYVLLRMSKVLNSPRLRAHAMSAFERITYDK